MRKFLVLAAPGSSTWMLVRELRRHFPVVRVVIEQKESYRQFLIRRLRKLGALETIGQIGFMLYGKVATFLVASRNQACIRRAGFDDRPLESGEFLSVASVNDEQTRVIIEELRPDLVVVSGTRIIRPHILDSTDAPFLNAHYGITPKYRGVHGGYWALAQSDRENCGVTVHLVDKGVDTGQILLQARIPIERSDNFFTYPTLQAITATPLMVRAARELMEGCATIQAANGPSRQWYHPTLWGYLWTGLRRGVW